MDDKAQQEYCRKTKIQLEIITTILVTIFGLLKSYVLWQARRNNASHLVDMASESGKQVSRVLDLWEVE